MCAESNEMLEVGRYLLVLGETLPIMKCHGKLGLNREGGLSFCMRSILQLSVIVSERFPTTSTWSYIIIR